MKLTPRVPDKEIKKIVNNLASHNVYLLSPKVELIKAIIAEKVEGM